MEPYIILYTLLLISALFDQNTVSAQSKKRVLIIWVVALTLFRGLRWRTGTDWEQFYNAFQYSDWNNIFNYVRYGESKMEFGYVFLNVLIKSLGGDYTMFLLITNFFILSVYARFSLRNSKTPILVFAIMLFSTPFFPTRQLLAAAIALLSYEYILSRSPIKFVIVILLASTVHTSALIFLPFYFILQARISTTVAVGIYVLTILASNVTVQRILLNFAVNKLSFLGDMVTIRLKAYMDFEKLTESHTNSILSNALFLIFLLLFSYLRTKKQYSNTTSFNVSYNAFIAFFCVSEFFRNSMEQMARNSNFFSFGFPLLLATAVSHSKSNDPYKPLYYGAFIVYMIYKLYNSITYHYPTAHIPYRSIFD